jgi:hypothetical protein
MKSNCEYPHWKVDYKCSSACIPIFQYHIATYPLPPGPGPETQISTTTNVGHRATRNQKRSNAKLEIGTPKAILLLMVQKLTFDPDHRLKLSFIGGSLLTGLSIWCIKSSYKKYFHRIRNADYVTPDMLKSSSRSITRPGLRIKGFVTRQV